MGIVGLLKKRGSIKMKWKEFKEKQLNNLQRKMCFNDLQMVFIEITFNSLLKTRIKELKQKGFII